MRAILLVGGLGTRLKSVVSDRPKPMAEVAGKPFLAYQIEHLRHHGIERIVLCLGHMAGHIRDYFGDGARFGVHIDYAIEHELLGTAGAVRNASQFIDGVFLLLNGDSYIDLDLKAFMAFHQDRRRCDPAALGTIAARQVPDAGAFGRLDVAQDHRITAFREKGQPGAGLVNAGVYVLEPAVVERIPAGRAVSIERETFPGILAGDHHLYAFETQANFYDIGTPESYQIFCRFVAGGFSSPHARTTP